MDGWMDGWMETSKQNMLFVAIFIYLEWIAQESIHHKDHRNFPYFFFSSPRISGYRRADEYTNESAKK